MPAPPHGDGHSRYPNRRQKHYAVVELKGTSEQVHVNDVVQVAKGQPSASEQPPRFAQVGWLFYLCGHKCTADRNELFVLWQTALLFVGIAFYPG